jgi:hypothetical protein
MRLDTFMNEVGIRHVHFLKIDAQGADLNVLKSVGDRLRDVRKVVLEVSLTSTPLYEGSHSKDECLQFMADAGFSLQDEESQSDGQEANLTFLRASRTEQTLPRPGKASVTTVAAGSRQVL